MTGAFNFFVRSHTRDNQCLADSNDLKKTFTWQSEVLWRFEERGVPHYSRKRAAEANILCRWRQHPMPPTATTYATLGGKSGLFLPECMRCFAERHGVLMLLWYLVLLCGYVTDWLPKPIRFKALSGIEGRKTPHGQKTAVRRKETANYRDNI